MTLLAAVLALGAVLLRRPPQRRPPEGPSSARVPVPASAAQRGVARGPRIAAGLVAGLGVGAMLGGPLGVLVGAAVAVSAVVGLGRLEPASARAERVAVAADAPLVADLLAAALAAGVPLDRALPVVARAVGGPLGRRLDRVAQLTGLGQPAVAAWPSLGDDQAVAPLVAAISRSERTGAPLSTLLGAAAADLRSQAHAAARAEIRAASVRAVLPLGLCLLPAFGLLGVAPLVGGLVAQLL